MIKTRRFKDILNKYHKHITLYETLHESQAILLQKGSNGMQFILRYGVLTPLIEAYMLQVFAEGMGNVTEVYLLTQAVGNGSYVFKHDQLGQLGFELLEEMDVNLEIPDFKMPFSCITIELPPDYIRQKVVKCPQEGEEILVGSHATGLDEVRYPAMHQPIAVTVIHEPEVDMILCGVIFDSDQTIKIALVGECGSTIEQLMQRNLLDEEKRFEDSLATTDEEWQVTVRCVRAALNLCLLMDEVGIKKVGPENPEYYARLVRQIESQQKALKRANRDEDGKAAKRAKELLINNQTTLKRLPLYYELAKTPTLYTIDQIPHNRTANGTIMTPHRRRGFYKLQPHGPGNTLRKRIRIAPVFVNKHLIGLD